MSCLNWRVTRAFWDGWQRALTDLSGDGRRWIISPFITNAIFDLPIEPGDRILTAGRAEDFAGGTSQLEPLRQLQEGGIDIRVISRLHAKVYAREVAGGLVGWIGSANLTHSGRDRNLEAMAGPFRFEPEFVQQLHHTWAEARAFEVDVLEREIMALQHPERLSNDSPVLAIRLGFKGGEGSLTLNPEWIGLENAVSRESWNGVGFPQIPYLRPEAINDVRRVVDKFKRDVQIRLLQHVDEGMYLFRADDRSEVMAALKHLESNLERVARDQAKDALGARRDFQRRFVDVWQEFAAKQPVPVRHDAVLEEALARFDAYLREEPIAVRYTFFMPMPGSNDPDFAAQVQHVTAPHPQEKLF
jgi:hypothetical protein